MVALTLSPGDSHCPNGGSELTDGNGNQTFACNGLTGTTGTQGIQGPVGPRGATGTRHEWTDAHRWRADIFDADQRAEMLAVPSEKTQKAMNKNQRCDYRQRKNDGHGENSLAEEIVQRQLGNKPGMRRVTRGGSGTGSLWSFLGLALRDTLI